MKRLTNVNARDLTHAIALAGDARLKFCERSELLETPVVKLAAKFGLVHSNGAFASSMLQIVTSRHTLN